MIAALLLALQTKSAPVAGDTLQPFTLRTLQSQPFEWRPERTTVLSFCAFWCDTWKQQLPRVDEARKATKGLPVDFVTISVDGRWTDKAKSVAVGEMLADSGGAWSHGIGIDRVPYTLVVDPTGRIVWSTYGTVRSDDVVGAIRSSLSPRQSRGVVYLTFDDFPSPRLSTELLDELRREDVKATFFCIGEDASARPDVVRRAVAEGQGIQVHSWSHDAKTPNVPRCLAVLKNLGANPDLYRPPGSEKITDLQGRPLAVSVVDPYDYQRPGTTELMRRVLSQARDGSVIQLHAGVSDSLAALPGIVANLRKRGFRFELLSSAVFPTRSH